MALTIRCPNQECGKAAAVSEDRIGHVLRCPRCLTTFRVLAPSGAVGRDGQRTEPHVPALPASLRSSDASITVDPVAESSPTATETGPTPPSPSPAAPHHIGRFQVRALLGSGAFGTVYRAYDPQLDRDVALKVARQETVDSPERTERFLREARTAAKLHHPRIVPVYEAGVAGPHHYIASTYIAGRTLAQTIAAGTLDCRGAVAIVCDLAEALAYAHAQGVVHRDVKPANVMLDAKGQPYLTDFGLARSEDARTRLTRLGEILGTPAYMAPEQAAGHSGASLPASD
jgi:serine/threonine protein kinase